MGADRESSPLGLGILQVIGWHLKKEREIPEVTARHIVSGVTNGCGRGSRKDI